ncbi:MAG TPA: hypothetical protein VM008_22515 [Phycisphaerae bacterium]|nr:hypothetical protein [Phycisphaerae bacterium]
MTALNSRFQLATPALPVVPVLFTAKIPFLVPLGGSNVLVPPQFIYHVACEAALRQHARDRAVADFRRFHSPSNN